MAVCATVGRSRAGNLIVGSGGQDKCVRIWNVSLPSPPADQCREKLVCILRSGSSNEEEGQGGSQGPRKGRRPGRGVIIGLRGVIIGLGSEKFGPGYDPVSLPHPQCHSCTGFAVV